MKKLTREQFNSLSNAIRKDKDWFNNFIKLCREYYEQFHCGGNLHIILDDKNIEDKDIFWCQGYAYGVKDNGGIDITGLMIFMTIEQRKKVVESYNLYA